MPNFVELSSQYRLYAFTTYQEMAAAKAHLKSVVLAKEFRKVRRIEANHYIEHVGHNRKCRNYLEDNRNLNTKSNALESLITALQVLYRMNKYHANYIIIESRF